MAEGRNPRFFYGYVVVAAGFTISLLMWGTYNTFGIFFKPLSSELGWTRAMTSGAFSLAHLLFGFLSIVAGRLTDKIGPKIVLVICGLFIGAGYLLVSQVSSIWQMYLFYGVIVGAGMSGADTPVLSTVARWFAKRRGALTGITKAGAGVGIFIVPLLADWLISSYGWRSAYVIIGSICLIGITSVALFLKRDPGEIGQLPDGAAEVVATDSSIGTRQFSLWETISTKQFWIFSSAWFLIVFSVQVVMTHIVPHVTDMGISTTIAATVIGVVGGASILGRIGMGSVSDRLGNKLTFIIAISLLVVALVLLQFAREVWTFYLFAILDGIAHGTFFTLISPLLAELFGLRSLGAILGAVIFIGTIGGAIGSVLAGRIFDITGSYQLAFLICLAFSVIAVILILFLRTTGDKTLR